MTFLPSNGHVGKPFSLPKVPGVCVKPQLFRGWRVQVATLKNYCRDLDLPFGDPRRAELLGIIERIEHHDQEVRHLIAELLSVVVVDYSTAKAMG